MIADSKSRQDGGTTDKGILEDQLKEITKIRKEWNERNQGTSDYGYARLDAIGAIFNEVSATALGNPDQRQAGECAGQLSLHLGYAAPRQGSMERQRREQGTRRARPKRR